MRRRVDLRRRYLFRCIQRDRCASALAPVRIRQHQCEGFSGNRHLYACDTVVRGEGYGDGCLTRREVRQQVRGSGVGWFSPQVERCAVVRVL